MGWRQVGSRGRKEVARKEVCGIEKGREEKHVFINMEGSRKAWR